MSAAGLLSGRTALVLGLDEIGAGIARRFAREGAELGLVDLANPSRADALAADLGATSAAGAISNPVAPDIIDAAMSGVLERLGQLDVLVCNLLPPANAQPLASLDDVALQASALRVRATAAAMRAAFPALQASGRGRILLVGHRYGESVGEALGAYNAAAWALIGFARTAAIEWGQHQITTNVLLPLAQTAEFAAARARRPAIIDRFVAQLPLRRVGDPVEDVGGAAAMLASDLMGFVNGQVVHADGGQHVAGPVLNPVRYMA